MVEKTETQTQPKVAIIVLNWNGWKDTIECLESVYQINYPNYDVIVVDNGSEDDSIENIKKYCEGKIKIESSFFQFSDKNKPIDIIEFTKGEIEKTEEKKKISQLHSNNKLILIKNDTNYGFAEGNNIGIEFALNYIKPEYLLLLNNDTIVCNTFLDELMKIFDKNIGIIGPKILDYKSGKLQFVGGKKGLFNLKIIPISIGWGEQDFHQYEEVRECDWYTGCCMLISLKVIKEVGLFNKKYFAYFEDMDFSFRVRNFGYKILYCPRSKIWHKGSSSIGGYMSEINFYLSTRNKIIFILDHCTFFQKILTIFYTFTVFTMIASIYFLSIRRFDLCIAFFRGLIYKITKKEYYGIPNMDKE